ncbi:hypothetical protein BN1708_015901 [Verticillium longisporum]|uniref:Uncharacterized protein n=1 Tax=Verticillium longisporum TaxID=100787 RepID=A0A0G4M9Z0_VERLO|nr:hypothetical protein BN1708_015901 [Verticillium longisporum]
MMATATSSQCPDQPPAHDPSSLLHTTDVVPPTAPDEQRPPSQADGQLPPNPTEEAAMALRKLLKGKEEEWSAVSRRTVFTILEPGKSPELAKGADPAEHHDTDGPNAIAVCLFIGAISAVGAAYATSSTSSGGSRSLLQLAGRRPLDLDFPARAAGRLARAHGLVDGCVDLGIVVAAAAAAARGIGWSSGPGTARGGLVVVGGLAGLGDGQLGGEPHTLLQRLIGLPQLRSLHIPKIADHAAGNYDPRELALQIVDIISLRPEIQLCYVGIGKKCFEILENKPLDSSTHGVATTDPAAEVGAPGSGHVVPGQHGSGGDEAADDDEEDASDDDEDASQVDTSEDENEDGPGGGGAGNANDAASVVDVDDSQSEASLGSSDSDADSFREADHVGARPRLRLREILFYDDKVAIFKARHGRL